MWTSRQRELEISAKAARNKMRRAVQTGDREMWLRGWDLLKKIRRDMEK